MSPLTLAKASQTVKMALEMKNISRRSQRGLQTRLVHRSRRRREVGLREHTDEFSYEFS
ncbi:MAG: hypothetical protein U1E51_23340 [Candidatus Binatia bacterium]|nr:hypothetical protein [Candidatus Binatia bacterium]